MMKIILVSFMIMIWIIVVITNKKNIFEICLFYELKIILLSI